jgi:hypothetical protein
MPRRCTWALAAVLMMAAGCDSGATGGGAGDGGAEASADGLVGPADGGTDAARSDAAPPGDGPPADGTGGGGWTELAPSADSRVIYVSSAGGNDGHAGLGPEQAVRTLAQGLTLLRNGSPDWLLLRRGDAWDETFGTWTLSGRSAAEPFVVTSYGDEMAPRPTLRTGSANGLMTGPTPVAYVAFVGLDFYADARDPGSPSYDGAAAGVASAAVAWLTESENVLFEDCRFRFFGTPLVVQSAGAAVRDWRLRRSLVLDSYAVGAPSHGASLANSAGVLLEENVFDHNGWNEPVTGAEPTVFNHTVDVQTDNANVVLRGNIFLRGASAAAMIRSGGIADNNLCVRHPIGFTMGWVGGGSGPLPAGTGGAITRNVILEGGDITADLPGGVGVWLGNISAEQGISVTDNVIAHDATAGTAGVALQADGTNGVGLHNAELARNVVYAWRGGIRWTGSAGAQLSDIRVHDNVLQGTDAASATTDLVTHASDLVDGVFSYEGDVYYSPKGPAGWFQVAGAPMGFEAWVLATGETTAHRAQVAFADPGRSVAAYEGTLGGAATFDGFVAALRAQSKATWRPAYEATAINAYIREGFRP